MEKVAISIITPTLNCGNTITSAIESCSLQSFRHFEHLIVDGGSEDNTLREIQKYSQIKVFKCPEMGIYNALNFGIQRAKGEIIGVLNGDDQLAHPDVLKWVFENLNNSDFEAIYGNIIYLKKENLSLLQRVWKGGDFKKNKFLFGWMPPHPAFYIKKRNLEKWGYYKPELSISADYEMMLRLLFKHDLKVIYVNKLFTKMSEGGLSNRHLKNRILAHWQDYQAWKINNLKAYPFTVLLKPLRKIFQFYPKMINWLLGK